MFLDSLKDHINCLKTLKDLEPVIIQTGELLTQAINNGHKILICGNGGSAADSQHFAAELVGRFQKERMALPAIALTTDTSILTAWANDYAFVDIFARQVEAVGTQNDVLIGISTSGNSQNVLEAVKKAKSKGMLTIGLLGKDGGSLTKEVEHSVTISNPITARIQEAHIFILHHWAAMIEDGLRI